MRWSSVALALILVASVGCSQNAVFELQIELPETPPPDASGEPWYALVQTRRASAWRFDFDTNWELSARDVQAVRLDEDRQWDCISVVSTEQDETAPSGGTQDLDLHVRVRFCRTPSCSSLEFDRATPERWYRVRHPFYVGQRTYWRTGIDNVHECPDCGGVGVCVDGRCQCTNDGDCPDGLGCENGNCLEDVDRCLVEGCIEGSDGVGYCRDGLSGEHYCEVFPTVDRPSACPIEQ